MNFVTTFRAPGLPIEPFSFATKQSPEARAGWLRILTRAPDDVVSRPLWEVAPQLRVLFIRERRHRFGVQEETGDPEYV